MGIAIGLMVFSANCPAEQIKFADWVGIEETDPATNIKSRQIGTNAKDGISTLWLSDPDTGGDNIELTLKSEKKIASVYFSYQIDKVETLVIRSAIKGCESNCLIDFIPKNGELIKTMKRGLKIKFGYDSYPDTAQKPTFSLRGFSKAYNWLLSE
jgi:invasion protein IalB